jgi:hypothetical protein
MVDHYLWHERGFGGVLMMLMQPPVPEHWLLCVIGVLNHLHRYYNRRSDHRSQSHPPHPRVLIVRLAMTRDRGDCNSQDRLLVL